jgi:hypothetical protein
MFENQRLVKGLLTRIRRAERETLEALRVGRVEHEPALTDRLFGAMEHVLNRQNIGGINWYVKTLTDRGRGSQEKEFGADFLAAFRVSLQDFTVAKGFLGQSKLIEPSQAFPANEATRLKDQCVRMLSYSSAAYVFLYSQQSGIKVVPATEIVAARDCNPHELTARSMAKFYEEHFECFIGDHDIRTADPQALEELRERYRTRRLLFLAGTARPSPTLLR